MCLIKGKPMKKALLYGGLGMANSMVYGMNEDTVTVARKPRSAWYCPKEIFS